MNSSIKMEVGIEDCLHIEFEYNRSKYHLKVPSFDRWPTTHKPTSRTLHVDCGAFFRSLFSEPLFGVP